MPLIHEEQLSEKCRLYGTPKVKKRRCDERASMSFPFCNLFVRSLKSCRSEACVCVCVSVTRVDIFSFFVRSGKLPSYLDITSYVQRQVIQSDL